MRFHTKTGRADLKLFRALVGKELNRKDTAMVSHLKQVAELEVVARIELSRHYAAVLEVAEECDLVPMSIARDVKEGGL